MWKCIRSWLVIQDSLVKYDKNSQFYTKKTQNFIPLIKMIAFEIIIIQGLWINNTFITFFALILLFFFYKNSFLSIILVPPLFATVLLTIGDHSINIMLGAFFIFFFILYIIRNNIIPDKRFALLFAYLLITIVGLFNAISFGDFLAFINWDYESILSENLSNIPKIVFGMGMLLFIRNEGYQFLKRNLILATKLIPISLIIVSIYFITTGHEASNWWNLGFRMTFKGNDPNDFSALLIALGAFSYYLVFKSISKLWTFVGIVSTILVVYSVLLTGSRGGMLTLVFTTILTLLLFSKRNFKRSILVIFFLIFFVLALFYSNLIDFNFIYERFFGKYITDISSLTAGRTDWWKAAFEAFKQKPLLGYGGSRSASLWINFNKYGEAKVMHNIYVEILIQYGIVGLTVFLSLIIRLLVDLKNLLKLNKKQATDTTYLIIPFISLASILFAGLALSLQWQPLLWYLIPLCLVIGSFVEKYVHENSLQSFNQKRF